jgi:hypothetical protein
VVQRWDSAALREDGHGHPENIDLH